MISLITAMTEDRVIGIQNRLPWHIPQDLQRFKRLTMGKPIIMGRKTLESIGKALPGRQSIVLTQNPDSIHIPGITVVRTFEEALNLTATASECFIIGGEAVYEIALPKADRLYLTLIHKAFEGDAFFPEFDLERDFEILENEKHTHPADSNLSFSFIVAKRRES